MWAIRGLQMSGNGRHDSAAQEKAQSLASDGQGETGAVLQKMAATQRCAAWMATRARCLWPDWAPPATNRRAGMNAARGPSSCRPPSSSPCPAGIRERATGNAEAGASHEGVRWCHMSCERISRQGEGAPLSGSGADPWGASHWGTILHLHAADALDHCARFCRLAPHFQP